MLHTRCGVVTLQGVEPCLTRKTMAVRLNNRKAGLYGGAVESVTVQRFESCPMVDLSKN